MLASVKKVHKQTCNEVLMITLLHSIAIQIYDAACQILSTYVCM